jgi:hypothetical protein
MRKEKGDGIKGKPCFLASVMNAEGQLRKEKPAT